MEFLNFSSRTLRDEQIAFGVIKEQWPNGIHVATIDGVDFGSIYDSHSEAILAAKNELEKDANRFYKDCLEYFLLYNEKLNRLSCKSNRRQAREKATRYHNILVKMRNKGIGHGTHCDHRLFYQKEDNSITRIFTKPHHGFRQSFTSIDGTEFHSQANHTGFVEVHLHKWGDCECLIIEVPATFNREKSKMLFYANNDISTVSSGLKLSEEQANNLFAQIVTQLNETDNMSNCYEQHNPALKITWSVI